MLFLLTDFHFLYISNTSLNRSNYTTAMDKFAIRYDSIEDAMPLSCKTSPLPTAPAKRPVGRPQKRKVEETITAESQKRRYVSVCAVKSETDRCVINASARDTNVNRSKRGMYKTFTVKQKVEVVKFAKLHGVRVAARHFLVSQSTVSGWCKTDFDSDLRTKAGPLPRSGRPLTYSQDIDDQLIAWVLEQRDQQISVSMEELCAKAGTLVSTDTFKASQG